MSRTDAMKMEQESSNVQEVLIEEMRDIYHAENQLVKALPKMVKAARDPELKKSLEEHLQKTEGHVERLQKAFEMLGERATGKPCKGMMGLVAEGSEHIQEGKKMDPVEADLGLIASAQKVEHYEISGYGTLRTLAEKIGQDSVADLLQQTENEEKEADETLTQASMRLLEQSGASM